MKGIFKGRWKTKPSALLVIMQPESLINFQTVPILLNAEGDKILEILGLYAIDMEKHKNKTMNLI